MTMSTNRVFDDILHISATVQSAIGEAIEKSFGYTTTPETNSFLMWALLVVAIGVAGRIFSTPEGVVKSAGTHRSSSGYDFRRYG